MRLLPVLLLAAAAHAVPVVRWIDKTGKIRADALAEVTEESAIGVEVRFADGTRRAIPGTSLIDMVRESERDPVQRELLALRTHTSGKDAAFTKSALEKIRARAKEAWMKEYAAAALALLSEESGETDALEAFLVRYPSSRFGPEILRARTRIRARSNPELTDAAARNTGPSFCQRNRPAALKRLPFASARASSSTSDAEAIVWPRSSSITCA